MYIVTFFTELGVPKTGLVPTVDIWRVSDNLQVVTAQNMSEVGGGFYKFEFTGYDGSKQYSVRCDGGGSLPASERYTYAGNEGFHDDVLEVLDNLTVIETLIRRVLGLSQENMRIFDCVYDATGKRMLSCTTKIYNNKVDMEADTNPIAVYYMESQYGVDGQLSSYKFWKD